MANYSTEEKDFEMPYFKLFFKDEMASISLCGLDAEGYGAFCLLRNLIFAKGFLPSDKKSLAKILRFPAKKFEKVWDKISPLFFENDGKLTIPDLNKQRAKYKDFIEKSREGGNKSAENRSKVGSTSVEGNLNVGSSNTKHIIHNSESKIQETHAHNTDSPLAEQATPEAVRVSAPIYSKSIHPEELIDEYADACNQAGQVKNFPGFKVYLRTGKADREISEFLANGKKLKPPTPDAMQIAYERIKSRTARADAAMERFLAED